MKMRLVYPELLNVMSILVHICTHDIINYCLVCVCSYGNSNKGSVPLFNYVRGGDCSTSFIMIIMPDSQYFGL